MVCDLFHVYVRVCCIFHGTINQLTPCLMSARFLYSLISTRTNFKIVPLSSSTRASLASNKSSSRVVASASSSSIRIGTERNLEIQHYIYANTIVRFVPFHFPEIVKSAGKSGHNSQDNKYY